MSGRPSCRFRWLAYCSCPLHHGHLAVFRSVQGVLHHLHLSYGPYEPDAVNDGYVARTPYGPYGHLLGVRWDVRGRRPVQPDGTSVRVRGPEGVEEASS